MARSRAALCVAFLANGPAVGHKNRLVAHPGPHQRILARVMQRFVKSKPPRLRPRLLQLRDHLAPEIKIVIFIILKHFLSVRAGCDQCACTPLSTPSRTVQRRTIRKRMTRPGIPRNASARINRSMSAGDRGGLQGAKRSNSRSDCECLLAQQTARHRRCTQRAEACRGPGVWSSNSLFTPSLDAGGL